MVDDIELVGELSLTMPPDSSVGHFGGGLNSTNTDKKKYRRKLHNSVQPNNPKRLCTRHTEVFCRLLRHSVFEQSGFVRQLPNQRWANER